jgi:DNA (cytosine-5)-methyltransferase 1
VIQVSFQREGDLIVRTIACQGHRTTESTEATLNERGDPAVDWMVANLRAKKLEAKSTAGPVLGLLDLFSGCGGFSLGAMMAGRSIGAAVQPLMAVDLDGVALDVYRKNLRPESVLTKNIGSLVDYQLWVEDGKMTFAETPKLSVELAGLVGRVDIVIGGPPCQGHSGFNNHTRGQDDRNLLYYTVPAVAVALGAPLIVIENVYNVLNDKFRVVEHTENILKSMGYQVRSLKLVASDYGVAQSRKRHFLVASKYADPATTGAFDVFRTPPVTVGDAIGDLVDVPDKTAFDRPAKLSEENQARIRHLFENDSYRLPNEVRPDCHKDGHTYPSVYGRLSMDGIANTITTGFASPGRGRYVHPTRQRALTAHEAARLQGFPDSFKFTDSTGKDLTNKAYGKLIGDAVPPPLGFVPVIATLLTHPAITKHEQGQTVGEVAEAQAA